MAHSLARESHLCADLAPVIGAWPALLAALKAGILVMIDAARKEEQVNCARMAPMSPEAFLLHSDQGEFDAVTTFGTSVESLVMAVEQIGSGADKVAFAAAVYDWR